MYQIMVQHKQRTCITKFEVHKLKRINVKMAEPIGELSLSTDLRLLTQQIRHGISGIKCQN